VSCVSSTNGVFFTSAIWSPFSFTLRFTTGIIIAIAVVASIAVGIVVLG